MKKSLKTNALNPDAIKQNTIEQNGTILNAVVQNAAEDKPEGKPKKKRNPLVITLFVSLICLLLIFIYALNWEKVAAIDWKTKRQVMALRWYAITDQIPAVHEEREHKILEAEMAEADPFPVIATTMSHSMPALMKIGAPAKDIIDVPLISQTAEGFPTGCEFVSATMVLQYYGVQASSADIYNAMAKSSDEAIKTEYGKDPRMCFVGNPRTFHGYGCYEAPIVDVMNTFLPEEWQAVNVSDTDLKTLETNYLSKGTPVIIWATINMSAPEEGESWKLPSGETYTWKAGEHCLVMVGADDEFYYFNDPNHEGEVIGYSKELVTERYDEMGEHAIIVSR